MTGRGVGPTASKAQSIAGEVRRRIVEREWRQGDRIPDEADLAVEFLPVALLARENGLPLVNIGQPFALPALRLTCLREAGVQTAADLRGKTLGSDYRGQELALSTGF